MIDHEKIRAISEQALTMLETSPPQKVRPVVDRVTKEAGITGNEWTRWLQRHAPDHALRWARVRSLWAEVRDSYLAANRSEAGARSAKTLGMSKRATQAAKKRLADKKRKTPGTRKGAGRPVLTDRQEAALAQFEERVTRPDPHVNPQMYAQMLRRRAQVTCTRHFLVAYRPDLLVAYREATNAYWQRIMKEALADVRAGRGVRREVCRKYATNKDSIWRRINALQEGFVVNNMVLESGHLQVIEGPPTIGWKVPRSEA